VSFTEGMKRFANLCRFSKERGYTGGVYVNDNAWNGFILFDSNSLRRCVKILPKHPNKDLIVHDMIPNYFENELDIARSLAPILDFSKKIKASRSYWTLKNRMGTYDVVHADGVKISEDDFATHMRTKHVLWVDTMVIGRAYPPSQLEPEDRNTFPGILSNLLLFSFARTVWRSSDGSSLPLWAAAASSEHATCPLTIYTGMDHNQFLESKW
jgi:hypothetical protein